MANSKIQANVKFTETGAEQTTKKVDKLKGSSNKAAEVIGKLNKKLDKIGKAAGISATIDSIKAVGSAVSSVKNLVGSAASSVYSFFNGQASAGDNLAKLSRSLGLTAGEFEKLEYAANRGGISSEEFSTSMKKFSVNVARAAAGEQKYRALFNAMGVSLKDRNGNLKTNSALMLEVADVYKKLTNAQDKNRVSSELFGKSAMKMSAVFEGGSGKLKELMDRRERLGGLLSPEDTKNAELFEDKVLDLSKAFESVKRKVAYSLMPAVNKLLNRLIGWWDGNGDRVMEKIGIYADKISGYILDASDHLPGFLGKLRSALNVVSGIVEKFGIGNTAVAALTFAVGASLVPALASASAASTALGVSLGPVTGILMGISGIAVGINSTIDNWDLLMSATWDDWKFVFSSIKKEVYDIVQASKKIPFFGKVVEGFESLANKDNWELLKSATLDDWKYVFSSSKRTVMEKVAEALEREAASKNFVREMAASTPPSVDNVKQSADPSGSAVVRQYSESKKTKTNRLQVDFTGMPKGVTVTPGPNFDSGVVDYSAGYVFGY